MHCHTLNGIRFQRLFTGLLLLIIINLVPRENQFFLKTICAKNISSSQLNSQGKSLVTIPSQFDLSALGDKKKHGLAESQDLCGLKDFKRVFSGPMADKYRPNFIVFDSSMKETRLDETVSADVIKEKGFDERKNTIILVHGHDQVYPDSAWLTDTRDLFKKNSAQKVYNFIIMDWGQYASHGNYFLVIKRVKGMGIYLADFLNKIITKFNYDASRIHIVAHSLGTHVSGFAGKLMKTKIGRITSLDVAGPCFGKLLDKPKTDRLDPSDASQVEVFHYDDGFLGLPGQHGQIDIYVNGGREQPGTGYDIVSIIRGVTILMTKLSKTVSYSHTRSTDVATMQLANKHCQHVAYVCENYHAFSRGQCGSCNNQNDQCFLMDLPYQFDLSDNKIKLSYNISYLMKQKKLYINTGSMDDLCLQHFQILVKTKLVDEFNIGVKIGLVYLDLQLLTAAGESIKLIITNQMKPLIFSHLLLMNSDSGNPFNEARVKLRPIIGLFLKQPIKVLNIEINYMSNIDPVERKRRSSTLCTQDAADNDGWTHLKQCDSLVK